MKTFIVLLKGTEELYVWNASSRWSPLNSAPAFVMTSDRACFVRDECLRYSLVPPECISIIEVTDSEQSVDIRHD